MECVAHARALGKPIAIVLTGNRRPRTSDPTTLGADQGRVLFERL